MNFVIPQSIYTAIFGLVLPDEFKKNISVKSSSLIAGEIENGNADIALMPSCDLIKHHEFYISKKIGLSFDGLLSNSYLYFKPHQNLFDEILLRGDVSTNEIVLSKILFSERFDAEVKMTLDTILPEFENKNYLIVGNENYEINKLNSAVSFSDQIADLIDFPYVNFVLVSKEENLLKEFNDKLDGLDTKIEDNIDNILRKMKLGNDINNVIREHINEVYFEITDNEISGLNELIRLIYYHGISEDIIQLKFV